jgi:hypothetical protein
VAIYANGPAYQSTTVTNSATLVFGGSTTTLAAITPAVPLKNVTLFNAGTTTAFVGGSSVTTAALAIAPTQQILIEGYLTTSGTTTHDLYAITANGTTIINAGLTTQGLVD